MIPTILIVGFVLVLAVLAHLVHLIRDAASAISKLPMERPNLYFPDFKVAVEAALDNATKPKKYTNDCTVCGGTGEVSSVGDPPLIEAIKTALRDTPGKKK